MNDAELRKEIERHASLMGGVALRLAERAIRMVADDDNKDKKGSVTLIDTLTDAEWLDPDVANWRIEAGQKQPDNAVTDEQQSLIEGMRE